MTTDLKWFGDEVLAEIKKGTPDALFDAGQVLVDTAAGRIQHNVTGFLKESGYVATEQKSTYKANKRHAKERKPQPGGAVAGFAAFYAKFVEFGTPRAAAKPFFRPTLDELKSRMSEEFAIKLRKKRK